MLLSNKRTKAFGASLLIIALLAGCAQGDRNVSRLNAGVTKLAVGDPYPVSARDLAAAMIQAGFTGDEVLEYGPEVRNAIGTAGGAQVNRDKFVMAIFSVQDGTLFVSSRDGSTFLREL